mgnify:CR=1 FL=1
MASEPHTLQNSLDRSMPRESIEDTLQKIVNNLTRCLESLALGSHEFDKVEQLFRDATTLEETLTNINTMTEKLSTLIGPANISNRMRESIFYSGASNEHKRDVGASNYDGLEKVLQKYEAEIREHIRVEQQMKIYSDSLEDRISELKSELATHKKSDDVAKELKRCQEELDALKNEKQLLERKLAKHKRRESSKSVFLDRTVKNKSMDHVSLAEYDNK